MSVAILGPSAGVVVFLGNDIEPFDPRALWSSDKPRCRFLVAAFNS